MLGVRTSASRHVAFTLRRGIRTRSQSKTTSPAVHRQPSGSSPSTGPVSVKQRKDGTGPRTSPQPPRLSTGAWITLGASMIFGLYVSQLAYGTIHTIWFAKLDPEIADIAAQKDVAARYDEIADNFDSDVNVSEWMMGLLEKRKVIARQCQGHVLEVSAGTGRNLGYYDFTKDSKLKSLTLLDLSQQMVDVCKRKFMAIRAGQSGSKDKTQAPVRFIASSALDYMPLAPDGSKYDTIVQTMGLCSTHDPVQLVVNMVRHLNIDNPDARILLLEHGRSTSSAWNKLLDASARKHAENYGCWANRDLDRVIVEAAMDTGLQLVAKKRANFDTTYMYELKAGPKTAQLLQDLESKSQQAESTTNEAVAPALSKWKTWLTG